MPKKRHQSAFSKPQSTAPTSLRSSGLQTNLHHHEEPQSRAVNDLLVKMRNAAISEAAPASASGSPGHSDAAGKLIPPSYPLVAPSMPPELSRILHPREGTNDVLGFGLRCGGSRIVRRAAGPRRPAGPAPPPSWLAQSRHAPLYGRSGNIQDDGRRRERPPASFPPTSPRASAHVSSAARGRMSLPGVSQPARGSLVDMALRSVAGDWDAVVRATGDADVLDLAGLPGSLKAALVSHLSALWWVERAKGTTVADLRLLLQSPFSSPTAGWARPSTTNEDFHYLDLTATIGDSITIREVTNLLFPRRTRGHQHGRRSSAAIAAADAAAAAVAAAAAAAAVAHPPDEPPLPESWDDPDAGRDTVPRALLPNLTHLSLALAPGQDRGRTHGPPPVSWHQLLELAEHLPTLTHLDLSYWPEPTLTLNARFAPADPEGEDGQGVDWDEAQRLVQRLSKALYGLEYLDITGCAGWAAALYSTRDEQGVDWVKDWSRMTTVVLRHGAMAPLPALDAADRHAEAVALGMERSIRSQRKGQGRFITVVCDD